MIHLDYRDPRPIYTQIVDGFRDRVLSGVLRSGERLPSVRELASQLAINPNTIQRAYRELELGDWIETIPGKGCFVYGIPAGRQTQRQTLLESFDKVTAALLSAGISREELVRHLQEGGQDNA